MIGQRRVRLWVFRSKLQPDCKRPGREGMAGLSVSMRALAAALLLFLATVSECTDPSGASRIPPHFSEEERVAVKEALKGESPPPCAQMWVPQSPGSPGLSPFAEGPTTAQARVPPGVPPRRRPAQSAFPHTSRHTVHGSGTPLASVSPYLAWRLRLLSSGRAGTHSIPACLQLVFVALSTCERFHIC